jgi:hypothetical protein
MSGRGTRNKILEDDQKIESFRPRGKNKAVSIMSKRKRKLTAAEKKRRRNEYMTVFINGKQKRVKRPPTIDGLDVDEFIQRNADPIWLHQNEMWEYMIDEDEP